MSHIHLPDGILPVWLWLSGYAIIAAYLLFFYLRLKKTAFSKNYALIGILSALMLITMSIEIIPPIYHINLAALSGIILGPFLSVLAILVVNIILAFLGHGGFTVIGLNTIVVSIEAVLGYLGFKFLSSKIKSVFLSAFIATFIALFISSWSTVGIVYSGTHDVDLLLESHNHTGEHKEAVEHKQQVTFDINKFILLIMTFSSIGWVAESIITAFIVNYINKVRPDILETKEYMETK
jgi:cobalt/nickel transport system permease protein